MHKHTVSVTESINVPYGAVMLSECNGIFILQVKMPIVYAVDTNYFRIQCRENR